MAERRGPTDEFWWMIGFGFIMLCLLLGFAAITAAGGFQ